MATFYSNQVLRDRQSVNTIAAATTLTAADVGVHILDAAAGATVTLPSGTMRAKGKTHSSVPVTMLS